MELVSSGHHKQLKPRYVTAPADRDMVGVYSQLISRGMLQRCYRAITEGYMTLQDPGYLVVVSRSHNFCLEAIGGTSITKLTRAKGALSKG